LERLQFKKKKEKIKRQEIKKKLRTDLVQTTDYILVVFAISFDHARDRIAEPFLKLTMGLKYIRHKKVHERPQFHQVILKRCAGEQ